MARVFSLDMRLSICPTCACEGRRAERHVEAFAPELAIRLEHLVAAVESADVACAGDFDLVGRNRLFLRVEEHQELIGKPLSDLSKGHPLHAVSVSLAKSLAKLAALTGGAQTLRRATSRVGTIFPPHTRLPI